MLTVRPAAAAVSTRSPSRARLGLGASGQRRAGPFGLAVHQVQRRVGLDIDDRDVVGDQVMQIPCHLHALLAGPAAQLGRAGPVRVRSALIAAADELGHAEQEEQPGRQPERGPGRGVAALPDEPGRPHPGEVPDDQRDDRGRPFLGQHRGKEGHDQRDPGQVRAAQCVNRQRGGLRDGQVWSSPLTTVRGRRRARHRLSGASGRGLPRLAHCGRPAVPHRSTWRRPSGRRPARPGPGTLKSPDQLIRRWP